MMRFTRTWIDTRLSHGQRQALVDWLIERSQNPTGELILQGLAELFPHLDADILPSVQSCIGWRNRVWPFEVKTRAMRADAEAARVLADAAGDRLAEANKKLIDSMIFSDLQALRCGEDPDPAVLERLHDLMLTAARATQAVSRVKMVELRQLDVAKAVLQHARELQGIAEDKGLDEDAQIERVRRRLFGAEHVAAVGEGGGVR